MMMTRAGASLAPRLLFSCLVAASLLISQAASAGDAASPKFKRAVFEHERATRDVRHVADWIVDAGDNHAGNEALLPFVIIDKKDARIYVFDPKGRLRGAAPALLGLGKGDVALPGIGQQELSNIAPKDRISPAGRFISELGTDTHGEDVLWMDYEGGYALHRVITSNPKERRAQRLATPTPLDNRISWGCINIPVKFYENVVHTSFKNSKGIVYVLPETQPPHAVFASYDVVEPEQPALPAARPLVHRVSTNISR